MSTIGSQTLASADADPLSAKLARSKPREVGPLPVNPAATETIVRRNGDQFGGSIFTFEIGRNRKSFTASEHVLSQSPVLEQWCTANQATLHFYLRNMSGTTFGLVLEYLYTHDLRAVIFASGAESIQVLGRMYIAGIQLRLNLLTDVVVTMLNELALSCTHKALLFQAAEEVYSHTPVLDTAFKEWFKNRLVSLRRGNEAFPEPITSRIVAKGGQLAVDISFARHREKELLATSNAERETRQAATWERRRALEREASRIIGKQARAKQDADRETDREESRRRTVDEAARREDERRARAYTRTYMSQLPDLSGMASPRGK